MLIYQMNSALVRRLAHPLESPHPYLLSSYDTTLPSDAQRQVAAIDNPSLLLHVMTLWGHGRHLTKSEGQL